jgi:ribosomal protein S18 acetylase RimI-like enzyme
MTRKYIKNFLIDPVSESYVQMVNNEVSGVVIIQKQGPFPGYIKVIAIVPNWRGKGYGRQLLEFSEERIFRDYPNVFLCVSSFNLNAQDFYRKMGYDRVGELKDYLIEGQSEILLRKTRGPVMEYK